MDLINPGKFTGTEKQRVLEVLISLTSKLHEDDLMDPEIYGLVSQLVQILDPEADPIPQEDVNMLSQIPSRSEQFKRAAKLYHIVDTNRMDQLVASLKSSGLFPG